MSVAIDTSSVFGSDYKQEITPTTRKVVAAESSAPASASLKRGKSSLTLGDGTDTPGKCSDRARSTSSDRTMQSVSDIMSARSDVRSDL